MRYLLFVLFMMSGAAAHADIFLEDFTWTELRTAIAAGTATIIIPIGGTEQSGPHIALGKHNARVKFLAEKIAEKLGHTLVAPVIAYVPEGEIDPPTSHMKFPGTITISGATFNQMLESAAKSFKQAGFKTIVFIGDHGSYQNNEMAVAAKLNRQWKGTSTRAFAAPEYYALAQGAYVETLLKKGYPRAEIGTHAALADTSLQLATVPSMVRSDKLSEGTAAVGVYGDAPKSASAELGQIGVDLIVDGTVIAIRKFLTRP